MRKPVELKHREENDVVGFIMFHPQVNTTHITKKLYHIRAPLVRCAHIPEKRILK
jgi:hypothetical protein